MGAISWRGNCRKCALIAQEENIVGLATHSGEPLLRWRRGHAAAVGAVLLDDLLDSGQTRSDA